MRVLRSHAKWSHSGQYCGFTWCGLTLFVMLSLANPAPGASPITIYDLRYTLSIDTANPAELNRAWDHCHATAVLQGLVNRNAPLLTLRSVDTGHARTHVHE